ncbi:hypothetical protein ACQ4PT_018579 [Festuca glaucescens]
MGLSRRFLYLLLDECSMWRSPCCTLHRIEPSRLFFPDASEGRAAPLPEPSISFAHSGNMQFSLLGRGKDKIVGVDNMGLGVLYDDGSHTVRPLPTMVPPESWRTLSVAVDGVGAEDHGSVYVIDADPLQDLPGQPVHQLMHVDNQDSNEEDWAWHSLPPPPYAHAPGSCKDGGSRAEITCHAVAVHSKGDRELVWVSTAGRGTYWLDTARHVWTKAGDWVLPFRGQALAAWELGLWIGFSTADSSHLCGSDLAAAADEDRPPAADHVWEGFGVPNGYHELYSHLVYLGGRRFCVAKVFDRDEDKCFAKFTGVELARGHGSAGRYRMTKHGSLLYSLDDYSGETLTGCVL